MPDILKPSCTAVLSGGLRRSKWKKPPLQQILRQWNIPTDRYAVMQRSVFGLRQRGRQPPHPEAEKRGARDPDGRCCEMNAQICLEKLKLCGVLSFATVDKDGAPQIRCISAIHYEPDFLYFFTARRQGVLRRAADRWTGADPRLYPVQGNDPTVRQGGTCAKSGGKIHTIFAEQPYLANVYPGDTRNIGIIFELRDFTVEYFNLGVKPIFREVYAVGRAEAEKRAIVSPMAASAAAPV